jgi:hypothetical protein
MPEINTALLVALMPAILGLVNLVKSFGLTGRAVTIASMVSGVVMALAWYLLPLGAFSIAYNGLVFGLAASGLFDIVNTFKPVQA